MTEMAPFEVVELLGEGSYGTVVAARRSAKPGSGLVALKVLKKEFVQNQGILQSTKNEAKALRCLDHINIVGVEKLLDIGGAPVMVMEFVAGVCLEEILVEEGGGLPIAIALAILKHLANALHCAHFDTTDEDAQKVQILHRDIKSSNLLLSVDGKVKLIDFGIARCALADAREQRSFLPLGARPYMAPERLDGAIDTPSIDVYSMGVLLYEMLTGEFLKASINPVRHNAFLQEQTSRLTLETEVVPLAQGVCELVTSMCAYDAQSRPSAKDVINAMHTLEALLPEGERESLASYAARRVKPLYAQREVSVPTGLLSGATVKDSSLFDTNGAQEVVAKSGRRWFKKIYVGGLLVVGLGLFMLGQFLTTTPVSLSTVSVPVGASSWIDGTPVPKNGQMPIPPGDHILQVEFEEDLRFACSFAVAEQAFVQYVVDDGYAAVQVDTEQPVRCVSQ